MRGGLAEDTVSVMSWPVAVLELFDLVRCQRSAVSIVLHSIQGLRHCLLHHLVKHLIEYILIRQIHVRNGMLLLRVLLVSRPNVQAVVLVVVPSILRQVQRDVLLVCIVDGTCRLGHLLA